MNQKIQYRICSDFNKLLKEIKIYTFEKNTEKYTSEEVKNQEIIDNLHKIICCLEPDSLYKPICRLISNPNTILCTRGDSKKDTEEHDRFFKNDLNKVFTVGAKSNYNFSKDEVKSIYEFTQKNEDNLVNYLTTLMLEVNKAMYKRGKKKLDYLNNLKLDKLDIETLRELKIHMLSLLHTDGRHKEFNRQTPFLSMSYGVEKFSIAKKFAFGKDSTKEKAYMYLYALNTDNAYYQKTEDLAKKLNEVGATWYEDKYDEIILFNGMFPHYLLGIFELIKGKEPIFIINPYLYEILDKNKEFDFVNGLRINQKNFKEYARDLGYDKYFYKTTDNKQYTSDIDGNNISEVIST